MRNIAYIAGLCFALVCSSCDRDRLYYATEEHGFVRLNVNWQPAQLEPNGISVYVFDRKNGKAVGKCRVCSDPNTIDIALPWENSTCCCQQHGRGAGGNQLHGYRQPVDIQSLPGG